MADKRPHMIIGLDFDGTLVEHDYPHIGAPIPGAFECLATVRKEHPQVRFILHTMRSGELLIAAAEFCKEKGLALWGINVNPEQITWTASPKPYCHLYIDDAALGAPLFPGLNGRSRFDWGIGSWDVLRHVREWYERGRPD